MDKKEDCNILGQCFKVQESAEEHDQCCMNELMLFI